MQKCIFDRGGQCIIQKFILDGGGQSIIHLHQECTSVKYTDNLYQEYTFV
jgi:hypothetical protein